MCTKEIRLEPPGMMSPRDLASALGISVATVLRGAKAGAIPGMRVGRSWRFEQNAPDLVKRMGGIPSRREMEKAAATPRPHWCDVHGCDIARCRCRPEGGPR